MKATRVALCVASLAAGVAPAAASAQGFGLNEIGSCAVGRGYAVTGAPCDDPSVIYWNPAAAATLRGFSVYGGGAGIGVAGDFTADYSGRVDKGHVPVSYPPHLFANYASGRWALGLGAYVPYGLTSQWGSDFPGRFTALKTGVQSIYVQPNLAIQVVPGRFEIGGGPVFGHSHVQIQQALDFSSASTGLAAPATFGELGIPLGTQFATARLSGNATAWGYSLGAHGRVTPELQVGIRYLSKLTFNFDDADATFQQTPTGLIIGGALPPAIPAGTPVDALIASQFAPGGALGAQKVSTSLPNPAQLQAGFGYTFAKTTTFSFDYALIQWSAFQTLPVTFAQPSSPLTHAVVENYDNASSYRFGLEHRFASIAGRVGYSHAGSPAPDETVTPILPDMPRNNYSLGVGLPLGDRLALDAGYLHVDTNGRRGRLLERIVGTPSATASTDALNSGFYRLQADIVSISLRAQF